MLYGGYDWSSRYTLKNQEKALIYSRKANAVVFIMASDQCRSAGLLSRHLCGICHITSGTFLPDNCIALPRALLSWPRTMQRQLGTGSRLIQRVTETEGNVPKMAKEGNLPCWAYLLLKKHKKLQSSTNKKSGRYIRVEGVGGGGKEKKAFTLGLFLSLILLLTGPQLFKSWTALSSG